MPGTDASPTTRALYFLRERWLRVTTTSFLLLIPCFWHRRIEAGDLASHVYNAWLAQLIEKGQAPGLYFARQWNNVLVDLALLKAGNLFGLAAAEKIVVSACVLIFFWGAFSLIAAMTRRPPWFLAPCVGMLAYGWTFNVGFFNYYLSLGVGFFAIAIIWPVAYDEGLASMELRASRNSPSRIVAAIVLGVVVLIAHPQGFLWLLGFLAYVFVWRTQRGLWRLILPLTAAIAFIAVRFYCSHHYETFSIWDTFGPGIYNGSDQLALYGKRYSILSLVALSFGLVCFLVEGRRRYRVQESWKPLRLPFELHWVIVFASYVLPDVLRIPLYAGWIGAFALRLTTISAVMGLCVLGFMQPRKWHVAGFGAIAVVFFAFLYHDTGTLNRMEQQIEQLVAGLPSGERVTATIWAAPDSRLPYIVHMIDRACVGRCFSFQNYEPASGQFRVRVAEDSPLAAVDPDTTQEMEAGEYIVRPEDLPMAQIYQCDDRDLTRLCIRQLAAGEANGRLGYHPPRD